MSGPAPGDFTRGDLWTGAFGSWIAFVVLMELTLVIAAVVSDALAPAQITPTVSYLPMAIIYALLFGGAVAGAVALLGAPLAALLGLLMRPVRSRAVHLVAFAVFGAAIGAVVVGIFAAINTAVQLAWPAALITVSVCAVSTTYGRWHAERVRRRKSAVLNVPGA
jgi:hypothetical protein